VVSIETIAPLQDNASADSARATVKFLRLETTGFILSVMAD